MKILYCIPALYNSGGMERILTAKANALVSQYGHQVHIATTCQKGRRPCFALHDEIECHDLDVDYESLASLGISGRIMQRGKYRKDHKRKLAALLDGLRPDVTVSMFTHETEFLPDLPHVGKTVLELHFPRDFRRLDSQDKKHSGMLGLINRWLDFKDRRQIGRYDKFVVLSHRDAASWGNLRNIEVIPNFVVLPEDTERQITKTPKTIICVGRLCRQKGFDLMIDAWDRIPRNLKEGWSVHIFGNGPDKGKLEELTRKKGLDKEITFHGATNEIRTEYMRHEIFCFPSRYEGFPLALMEAMSMGKACVSFDCPCGPGELLADKTLGSLVAEGDTTAMAEALAEMMTNPDRHETGENAQRHIRAHFTPPPIMAKWDALFRSLE